MNGNISLLNGMQLTGTWETSARHASGEVVFFTGMTGYQEVLTDPSYAGQIIAFTYPLIGQYGLELDGNESAHIQVAGVLVQTLADHGGRPELKDWLEKEGIPVLSQVDVRALVHVLREEGDQFGVMSHEMESNDPQPLHQLTERVTTTSIVHEGNGEKGHVVCLDFGVKASMVGEIVKRGYRVTSVPYDSPKDVVDALRPDAILVSNGPGDPRDHLGRIEVIRELALSHPTLGICMGHQLLALAFGCNIEKQTYGHRGSNHPVRNVKTNEVWMTSQNHGYVVERTSIEQSPLELLYENVNDHSVEGLVHPNGTIFTTQFHPEASPGPTDAQSVFDRFDEMIQQGVNVYA
ncbi:carbamoyl phosphate synthase small subunit [Exiguobacterium aestuarii]|uniref:Carbamoyl phosphate synthase small chain n=1 Tax=Exiguobacterium aestuarii TaxID=273527 RepID=A0ABW2PN40_9BACL|nr:MULTISPECIES: carbamoyl phosphate synthase small subunit [Exiguobacterium]MCT4787597.1 carbamoyl phosphate synthase small subunit [Exiguobacterium aestuarii]